MNIKPQENLHLTLDDYGIGREGKATMWMVPFKSKVYFRA